MKKAKKTKKAKYVKREVRVFEATKAIDTNKLNTTTGGGVLGALGNVGVGFEAARFFRQESKSPNYDPNPNDYYKPLGG
jgi:hypothetical protein